MYTEFKLLQQVTRLFKQDMTRKDTEGRKEKLTERRRRREIEEKNLDQQKIKRNSRPGLRGVKKEGENEQRIIKKLRRSRIRPK